ncbi:MAG: DUF4340 domain-containing protein [Fibrobacterota bacterium]
MKNTTRTTVYIVSAALILLIAVLTAPRVSVPQEMSDEGTPFFPDFTDLSKARSLEVVTFDSTTGEPVPFKVVEEKGLWKIPSQYDYPADGKEMFSRITAALIELERDEYRGRSGGADLARLGLVNPLKKDDALLSGRGKMITLRTADDIELASIIIGKKVEGRPNYRYMRTPEGSQVYAARFSEEISTDFTDWIENDLLTVNQSDIHRVHIQDYSVDENTGRLNRHGDILLTKKNGSWTAPHESNDSLNSAAARALAETLDTLNIIGVRPKPAGINEELQRVAAGASSIEEETIRSLQEKGFFFGSDGQLYSNRGEITVTTDSAVTYTLRFGEVAPANQISSSAPGRYLFISAAVSDTIRNEPPRPADTLFRDKADSLLTEEDRENRKLAQTHAEWTQKRAAARARAELLNSRFGKWYYIISAETFDTLNSKKKKLFDVQ